MWVRLLTVPFRYLFPAALFFVCVGVYSTNNNLFDVGMVTLFGVAGYALMRLRFEPAPLLLGFVLGPMVEENRRALLLSRGELSIFVTRPISLGFVVACVLLICLLMVSAVRQRRRREVSLLAAQDRWGYGIAPHASRYAPGLAAALPHRRRSRAFCTRPI